LLFVIAFSVRNYVVVSRLFCLIGVTVLLAACGGASAPEVSLPTQESANLASQETTVSTPEEASVSAAQPVPDATGLVARVNGVGISQLTFDAELAKRTTESVADPAALAQQVLDGLIERELVRQYAKQNGIVVTPEEARAEMQSLKDSLASPADWEAFLTLNNLTEPEMVNAVLEQLMTSRVRDGLFAGLSGDVPQAHARHILVATEAEAADLLAQLQNGANFEELARTRSADNATRETGGDLGWFTREELIDPRLGEVIFSLQPGAIAGPIPSRVGYHIVQLIETANRAIEPERMGVLMDAIYTTWLSEQFAAATIEQFR
jgi:parvulin-like peptidyl-prolyl isomerase